MIAPIFIELDVYKRQPINYTENSDTLSTIYLSLTDPLNGTAILSWNELHQPPLTSFSNYEILREYPSGIWSTIGNTISTNFIDTIYPCSALSLIHI